MRPTVSPIYQHSCETCTCLGQMTIDGVSADLFVCQETVIARFSDAPDDYRATHVSQLRATSDVFLLAAFRLYRDTQGEVTYRKAVVYPTLCGAELVRGPEAATSYRRSTQRTGRD